MHSGAKDTLNLTQGLILLQLIQKENMIKKISLILLIIILSSSCGKKGDPVYNEKNQNSMLKKFMMNAVALKLMIQM